MKVFSTFTGIWGFELGMKLAWLDIEIVWYSEIDKYAISVYEKHFPWAKNYWDISKIDIDSLPDFDMIVWWFPCQDLSIAKKDRKWLEWDRSWLFWKLVEILEKKKPKYFCFENVASMKKEDKDIISKALWVQPVMINAAWVSAQQRKRLYWNNWHFMLPEDRWIILKDILESWKTDRLKSYCIDASYYKWWNLKSYFEKWRRQLVFDKPVRIWQIGKWWQWDRIYSIEWKSVSLSANWWWRWAKTWLYNDQWIRKLTPIECERLQCFPDNWTEWCSNTQRYKMCWNAVNVEVIKHIFKTLFT